jgi:hypothetical protein
MEEALGSDHQDLAEVLQDYATALGGAGRLTEASAAQARAEDINAQDTALAAESP